MTSLAERAARFPEPWRPAAGDVLEGEVTELNWRDSEYSDEQYPILTVLDDEGVEWAFHCFHTMARLEVERKKPLVGDRVAVAYHGLGQAQPGMQPPHRYRLIVDRKQPQQAEPSIEPPGEPPASAATPSDDIPF